MNDPTVSVVIPAYRAARTIRRAVSSAIEQTAPPLEILVIDDGSPEDDLPAALADFDDRVLLIQKNNGGAASARNLGIDIARGDFVAFLDADDYWEPSKLRCQLDVIRRHPEVGLVSCRYFNQPPGEARVASGIPALPHCDRVLADLGSQTFEIAFEIWTSAVLVRRSLLETARFVSGLEPAEDRDLWIRLLQAAPAYFCSQELATAVLEPGSLSRTNVDRDYGNMYRVLRRHASVAGDREQRRWENHVLRRWAAGHLGNGNPRAAIKPALRRLGRQPFSAEAWYIVTKSLLTTGRHWSLGCCNQESAIQTPERNACLPQASSGV